MDATYIDHNGLLAELVECESGVDGTPIEFHRAADTVDTASENDYTVVIECHIV
jgi:hypothetical protein